MATAGQELCPGIVPATKARRHIRRLRAGGMGRRSIADACDVSDSIIRAIAQGRHRSIRRETERRILSVDRRAVSDGCLVSAQRTIRRIDKLLGEGFTRRAVACRIGSSAERLSIGGERVRAVTALRVERLFFQTMG